MFVKILILIFFSYLRLLYINVILLSYTFQNWSFLWLNHKNGKFPKRRSIFSVPSPHFRTLLSISGWCSLPESKQMWLGHAKWRKFFFFSNCFKNSRSFNVITFWSLMLDHSKRFQTMMRHFYFRVLSDVLFLWLPFISHHSNRWKIMTIYFYHYL